MVSRPNQERASGASAAEEEASKVVEEAFEQPDPAVELDDKKRFRTAGFSRMRFHWRSEDAIVVQAAQKAIEDRIMVNFDDAYRVMHDLFMIVRTPKEGPDGEIIRDQNGWPEWARTASGTWAEDFSRLSKAQREDFLFRITTRIFAWEQAAAEAWTEAMFAKSAWEEAHGNAYNEPMKGTIEDRTAFANRTVVEERYFAVFVTAYSRRADAIVRSLGLLAQRLKDTLET